MSKEMWLPSGIVDCDNFKEDDITFDNMANLCYTQRAWANVTGLRWPVSNHAYLSSMICSHLLKNGEWEDVDRYRSTVFTMFHDCEEVFVTDIPTPFKSPEVKKTGDDIRNMIFSFLGIKDMDKKIESAVALSDMLSLLWEIKHGYKHWKRVSVDCILPSLEKRIAKIVENGIDLKSVEKTYKWIGIHPKWETLKWSE